VVLEREIDGETVHALMRATIRVKLQVRIMDVSPDGG
jgi:hypothetical protein